MGDNDAKYKFINKEMAGMVRNGRRCWPAGIFFFHISKCVAPSECNSV